LRERTIRCFVPVPFWSIKAKIIIGITTFEVTHEKKVIERKQQAQALTDICKQKFGAIINVQEEKIVHPPPVAFDLGSLQKEAYKIFRCTPTHTLSIAQKLYLDALISYPRTSSQKLPPQIGYEKILKKLAENSQYTKLAEELLSKQQIKPNEGKKEDAAHPAIYPTGKIPQKQLVGIEKNIYNLIVHRFLAVFGDNALLQKIKATIEIGGEKFSLNGKQICDEGWLHFYRPFTQLKDKPLPRMVEGQIVKVEKILLEDKFTKPPLRYNPSSLLNKMEKENIGTKATRAGIIETLYERKYIQQEKIEVSDLGFEVVDVLSKYCPEVVSAQFTQEIERRMDRIQQNKDSKEKILSDVKEVLKIVTTKLKKNEKTIGRQLSKALVNGNLKRLEIGPCPICSDGKLVIFDSKKNQNRFVVCTNYLEGTCKATFSLPQRGKIKPSGKLCRSCNWYTLKVSTTGKNFQTLCFNPKCASKKRGVNLEL
ncbi:MAG: DNA topoisomerase I, partial [Crenarchaeota archaeon]|nr:DNA topoisomerase I [Thermoproteota archaeon]